ncbi:MAG: hypothetical protein DWQ01_00340 [Planctomycetota bacterium]|nr:MAG: hypothetical protein DWQ01_00340 [Planctomycetota bacterium]
MRRLLALLSLAALATLAVACGPAEAGGDEAGDFASNAFPPTLSDTDYHQNAWSDSAETCMVCHKTGINDAPKVVHEDMAAVLLDAKCRSCHVLIEGQQPIAQ